MDKNLKFEKILAQFLGAYREAVGHSNDAVLELFVELLRKQMQKPFVFEPYHQKIRSPIDYYKFSLDFIRPLIDLPHSHVHGLNVLKKIESQLKKGENCILLANHQTETDPQVISILLEKTHPHIGEKIIYVAGERVVTDPLAVPFSMGCDLLCIYSKRYIDHPPELKTQKQLHNKNTMELMSRLLKEGGKIIYVAPSGGRDRRNAQGQIEVAPFDPSSVEMFALMAKKAKTPTHFYPFSLFTYDLLPPPETIQKELGEERIAKRCPVQIAFAPEFDMEKFPGFEENDKTARRKARADAIWSIVNENYERISCSTP
jgi:glycerol-3-phosphate O-acyltransferase